MWPTWLDTMAPFASLPLMAMLSGAVTSSSVLVPVSSHCFVWVATTADSISPIRVKLPNVLSAGKDNAGRVNPM
jgi:hypothetical protein